MIIESERNGKRRKVLVAYATKNGATAKIAQWLSEGMSDADVDVLDVDNIQSVNYNFAVDYDFVVLGTPVRLGKIHPAMAAFLEENRRNLDATPKALFVVCLFTFLGRRYLQKMKQHVGGEIATYRVFSGKLGILNMLDEEYAKEAGKAMWRAWT